MAPLVTHPNDVPHVVFSIDAALVVGDAEAHRDGDVGRAQHVDHAVGSAAGWRDALQRVLLAVKQMEGLGIRGGCNALPKEQVFMAEWWQQQTL